MIRKEKLEELKQYTEEYKTVSKTKIEVEESQKFLQSERYDYLLKNGRTVRREKLTKGKDKKDGSAAIICPMVGDEILTVIEPRVFTKLGVGVGFPAGYIEKDEKPVQAALRELKEETGYVPEQIIEVDSFYQDEGCSAALNHLFIAYNCKKVSNQSLDQDEMISYMTFTLEELFDLEQLEYIMGCNSKLLLHHIKERENSNEKI